MGITEARKKVQTEKAKRSLIDFTRYTMMNYEANWHHKNLGNALDRLARGDTKRLMVFMPPRNGKEIADSTPIFTTEGWKTHGELSVGDYVFHPSGKPVRVKAVSEKTPSDWVVTFSNQEQIRCHANHEWLVWSRSDNRYKIMETKEFKRVTKFGEKSQVMYKNRSVYQVDNFSPLDMTEKEYDMPPYVLGAWLGDGTKSAPVLTLDKDDTDILEKVESFGYEISTITEQDGRAVRYHFSGPRPNVSGRLWKEVKILGLNKEKHIPRQYFLGSLNQRLELLAGLIDTDGHVGGSRRVTLSTSDERLRDDVLELCTGLGMKPYFSSYAPKLSSSGVQGKKTVYQIGFNPNVDIPTVLERKKVSRIAKQRRIGIVDVSCSPNGEQGHCIQVDSEDGLYLAGEKLITTHNSELVTRRFPPYLLGHDPDLNIIGASYSGQLASSMNRDIQRIIDSPEYRDIFPDTTLNNSISQTVATGNYMRNSNIFEIVGYEGSYTGAGIGGGITGRGADFAIIDDPIKNRAEAESKTIRDRVYEWFTSTLYTRLEKNGRVLLTLTRWHEDDLAGRLLRDAENNPEMEQWDIINYPAIYDSDIPNISPDDPREEGEALWPAKYDLKSLQIIKKTVGSYDWSALYQQMPTPSGGGIIKRDWFQYYKQAPKNMQEIIQSWDLSFGSQADDSSYVVGQVWGRKGADKYLLDQVRAKMDFPETLTAIRQLTNKWKRGRTILVEDKANGPAVIASLKKEISGIIPVKPEGGKMVRAQAVSPDIEAGNVYLPEGAPWLKDFIEEVIAFPNGLNDDSLDSMTQALNRLSLRGSAGISSVNPW